MALAATPEVGVFAFIWIAFLLVGMLHVFMPANRLLFSNASIVNYWRRELGGNPDEDDPFDLRVACDAFKARCAAGREMARRDTFAQDQLPIGAKFAPSGGMEETMAPVSEAAKKVGNQSRLGATSHGHGNHVKTKSVKAGCGGS